MSLSRLSDIDAAVIARLQTINGSGGYTYDFSPTGRIVRGDDRPDGHAPDTCVLLSAGTLAVAEDETLTQWGFTLEYVIGAWAPASADTPAARIAVANRLLAELWTALTAVRTLATPTNAAGAVDNLRFEARAVDGQTLGQTGCGGVAGILTLTWSGSSL